MIQSSSTRLPVTTQRLKSDRSGWWFIAPFFALFAGFSLFGLGFTFFLSFQHWDPIHGSAGFVFRGLRGYYFVLTDPGFWTAMGQSLVSAIPRVLLQHLIAFPFAYALYLLFRRSLTVLGMLIFLPYLAIPVGLSASLTWFYSMAVAPINDLLGLLHGVLPFLPETLAFGSSFDAFFNLWNNLGWNVLLYLMAFASIPRSTLEAAQLDGAGFWQQVSKIAVPLARPMIFMAFSMSLVNTLQASTWRPMLRFRRSPVEGLPAYIYREAFSNQNFDLASVMTWLFFCLMVLLILLVYLAFGRNFTQIEQPAQLESNTLPVNLPPVAKLVIQLLVIMIVFSSVVPFLVAFTQATQHQPVSDFRPAQVILEPFASENYSELQKSLPTYWRNFWNSLYVSSLAAIGAALISGLAGFAFAVLEFRFKRLLFGVVMCALVFPALSNAVPFLLEMQFLGWLNTPRALWLPTCVSALGVFVVRQYALNALPKNMVEAARVDGANDFTLFWRIGLPNLIPALVSVSLLVFVTSWNHLDAAFYIITSIEGRLLTDALGLLTANQARTGLTPGGVIGSLINPAVLGAVLGMVPVLIVYALSAGSLGRGLGIGGIELNLKAWWQNRFSRTPQPDLNLEPNRGGLGGADGVRAIGVLSVLFSSLWRRLQTGPETPTILRELQAFFTEGVFGIDVLLVLSGVLFSLSFWRRYLEGTAFPSLQKYVRRRFTQIAPAFWVCLIVSFICSGMLFFVPPEQQPFRWLRLLGGLTFTNWLHYVSFFPVELNPPLWVIGYGAFCLSLMPVLMFGMFKLAHSRRRKVGVAFLYWLVVLLLVVLAQQWMLTNLIPDAAARGWDNGLVGGAKFWTPNYNALGLFGHFVIGVLGAGLIAWRQQRMLERHSPVRHLIFDAIAVVAGLGALVLIYAHSKVGEFDWSLGAQPYAFPGFAILVALVLVCAPFSTRVYQILDNRFFRFTARIGFSLFLWHYLILELLWLLHNFSYNRFDGLPDFGSWLAISVFAMLAIFAIASASWTHIEQPFQRQALDASNTNRSKDLAQEQ